MQPWGFHSSELPPDASSFGEELKAAIDKNHYETQIKVSDIEVAALNLKRHKFHGDWNYTISPRRTKL